MGGFTGGEGGFRDQGVETGRFTGVRWVGLRVEMGGFRDQGVGDG